MSSSGSGERKSGSGSGSGESKERPWTRGDRRAVSRGNTIRRAARTQPPVLIRSSGHGHTHADLRSAIPRAIRTHGSFRQRLLGQARQMGRENRDFRASMGTRISSSKGSSETPREVSSQISDFAEPNYISDLTKTSMGFPSERVARRIQDREKGVTVVKRAKSPRKRGGRRTRRRRKSRRGRKSRRRKSRRKSRKSRRTRRRR